MPESSEVPGGETPNDAGVNVGAVFLAAFKWLLLILFALLIRLTIEGVARKVAGEGTFSKPYVIPFVSSESTASAAWCRHFMYFAGFLQLAFTLFFAMRYFVCLIDPIERAAGIHSKGMPRFLPDDVARRLGTIRWEIMAFVIVIALPEFLLTFHSAVSFQSPLQWTWFLISVVLWDSLMFFVVLPILLEIFQAGVRKEERASREEATQLSKNRDEAEKQICRDVGERLVRELNDDGSLDEATIAKARQDMAQHVAALNIEHEKKLEMARQKHDKEGSRRAERERQFKEIRKEIRKSYEEYNILDFAILAVGSIPIWGIYGSFVDATELVWWRGALECVVLFLMCGASVWAYWHNVSRIEEGRVWGRHVQVLRMDLKDAA